MKPPSKIAVIGCGGIACALVPTLANMHHLVLVDADKYEPGNAARQFPALRYTKNKAEALAEMIDERTMFDVLAIPKFVKNNLIVNEKVWAGVDFIIGAVDNNASRRILVELADNLEIPCILAGNEHQHGEAHLFIPGGHNPFDHFDFPETEPTPWACNSEKNLDENPQTLHANAMAASATLQILLSWGHVRNPDNAIVYSRLDVCSSTAQRARDFKEEPAEACAGV